MSDKNEVVVVKETPDSLLSRAIETGASLETIEKFMELKERHEKREAEKAFHKAFAKFKKSLPTIKKKKTVLITPKNGGKAYSYNYAPLGDIDEQVREPLANCGLSVSYDQNHGEYIEVTCIVTHFMGHSKRVSMKAKTDESGSKNSIQGIGSTVTYLQRYTLTSVLGITTADEDMDARLPDSKETIEEWMVIRLQNYFKDNVAQEKRLEGVNRLLKYCNVGVIEEISISKWKQVCTMLKIKSEKE